VLPITAVVTILRYGERLEARVLFAGGEVRECDPGALETYVSEEKNPGNAKGVTAAEVFVPSSLLESGMCLVDTPGIGSVFTSNTETTRAFVPHIDGALVVFGADPPISADEMVLIQEVAGQTDALIFVLNKADRLLNQETQEASRFAERVLVNHLGRPIEPILQVCAAERLAGIGPQRDWNALVRRLDSLARNSGADLVRDAEARGVASLVARLLGELAEQHDALVRPLEETQARIDLLRRAVADAERSLGDLSHIFAAEQERLSRKISGECDRFIKQALPESRHLLREAIQSQVVRGPKLRRRAMEHTIEIAKQKLHQWREEKEPQVVALYGEATSRLVELANNFQTTLANIPGLSALPPLGREMGFRTPSRFYFHEIFSLQPFSLGRWLLDLLIPHRCRAPRIESDANKYLEWLLKVNSTRVQNDFDERILESRRSLESEIGDRFSELATSGERALENARRAQAAGSEAVQAELARIQSLRATIEAISCE
jgi:hypothetical protein